MGLVEMIRGLANPKSEGARREVHSHPQPCLQCGLRQGRRGGKDCDVQTGIIQFNIASEVGVRYQVLIVSTDGHCD